jgi:two-component system sensor histidine kinase AlgZ
MLQPLLENAVYHGIEPLSEGGLLEVKLQRIGNEFHMDVRNPCRGQCGVHQGNKMALENIRERLALQFDVEAKYTVESGNDFYHVHIQLPYVKENLSV